MFWYNLVQIASLTLSFRSQAQDICTVPAEAGLQGCVSGPALAVVFTIPCLFPVYQLAKLFFLPLRWT